jgi:hypothetical protein
MRLAGVVGAVVGIGLFATQVMAAASGDFSLKPREAKEIYIGATARELRICNDVASGSPIGITLGGHSPVVLPPGECTYEMGEMGDRILATNQGDNSAIGTWRATFAPSAALDMRR